MKILVLGGTGSIGSAVVKALVDKKHKVYSLGRTDKAIDVLQHAGAVAVKGDLKDPAKWVHLCDGMDGVVHAAAEWGDEMGIIDQQVTAEVLSRLQSSCKPRAFIYTGGCWLYGETGNSVATEESAFNPLPSFAWTIPSINKVISTSNVRGMVIHPAMVYERDGGVFERFVEDARNLGYVRIASPRFGKAVRFDVRERQAGRRI